MNRPVHEIRLGAVRALIWEDRRSDELNYRVSVPDVQVRHPIQISIELAVADDRSR